MPFLPHPTNPALCFYIHPPVVKVCLHRREGKLIAIGEIDTPLGPLRLSASVPEAKIREVMKRLIARACLRMQVASAKARGESVESGAFWSSTVKRVKSVAKGVTKTATNLAKKVSTKRVVDSLARRVKSIAKNPVLAKSLGLITTTIPKVARNSVALAVTLVEKARAGSKLAMAKLVKLRMLARSGNALAKLTWNSAVKIAKTGGMLASTVPANLLASASARASAAAATAQRSAESTLDTAQAIADRTANVPAYAAQMANQLPGEDPMPGSDAPTDDGSDAPDTLPGGQEGESDDSEGAEAPGEGADDTEGTDAEGTDSVAGYGRRVRTRHYDPARRVYTGEGPTYFEEALVSVGDMIEGVPFSVAANRMGADSITFGAAPKIGRKPPKIGSKTPAQRGIIARPKLRQKLSLNVATAIHKHFPLSRRPAKR